MTEFPSFTLLNSCTLIPTINHPTTVLFMSTMFSILSFTRPCHEILMYLQPSMYMQDAGPSQTPSLHPGRIEIPLKVSQKMTSIMVTYISGQPLKSQLKPKHFDCTQPSRKVDYWYLGPFQLIHQSILWPSVTLCQKGLSTSRLNDPKSTFKKHIERK